MVVGFADGVLSREPDVDALVESVVEAGTRKRRNALVDIVHALNNAVGLEVEDKASFLRAVWLGNAKLSLAAAFNAHFGVLVNVAVSVTGNADGLFPCGNVGNDALYEDRASENGAVEDGADSAVRRFPHALEVVLVHSRRVGGDGRALNADAVLFGSVRRVYRNLIVGFVSVNKTEVVVFGFEVNVGEDKRILELLPDDSGHFVAVHLNDRRNHFNLFH